MIFDGLQFAKGLEVELKDKLAKLPRKKIIAILDPNNSGGKVYTRLKQKMAERLGVDFEIMETLMPDIESLNRDQSVNGIMIQLPFPNSEFLINLIDLNKDIDGLRDDSLYKPAVVKAVLKILPIKSGQIVIVGSKGEVGRRLMLELPQATGIDQGDSLEVLKDADIIVSATGQTGLIKPEMVKKGVVAIDVGFPKGDLDPEIVHKASFFTPVPGGVGPVTVVSLFENLLN
jgi:methylenetetrahydrofolate dehydrogenase (NADP+) / methenyltetrahydrofolate cyclohydrolase